MPERLLLLIPVGLAVLAAGVMLFAHWRRRRWVASSASASAETVATAREAADAATTGTPIPDALQQRLVRVLLTEAPPVTAAVPYLCKILRIFAQSPGRYERVLSAASAIAVVRYLVACESEDAANALAATAAAANHVPDLDSLAKTADEYARKLSRAPAPRAPSRWIQETDAPSDLPLPPASELLELLVTVSRADTGEAYTKYSSRAADYSIRRLLALNNSEHVNPLSRAVMERMHLVLYVFARYPGKYDRNCSGECIIAIINALAAVGDVDSLEPLKMVIGAGEYYEDCAKIRAAAVRANEQLLEVLRDTQRSGLLVRPAEQPSNELLRPTVATSDGDAETLVRPAYVDPSST